MAEFYELGDSLLEAAAEQSPPSPKKGEDVGTRTKAWIARQSKEELSELVVRLLMDDVATVRGETLSRIRDEAGGTKWPTAEATRTLGQLRETAEVIHQRECEREARAQEKARRARLAKIAAEPQKVIAQAANLVKQRSTRSYAEAAQSLADLREALGPDHGPQRAQSVAETLRRENPTLKLLISALRKQGLLGKRP